MDKLTDNIYENYDFNDEDEIRQPDQVVKERLIEDTRCEFQKQMDEALYLSMQEIKFELDSNQKFEEKVINEYINETNRRKENFKDLLINLNKLRKFDKEINEIYEIIEPIIQSYCEQFIQKYEFDEYTYNKIFNTIEKIRINKLSLQALREIILLEIK